MSCSSRYLALVFFVICRTLYANITSGYYYIYSDYYDGRYITEDIHGHVLNTIAKGSSYSQVWYLNVSGSSVTIKNALTDRYVQQLYNLSYQYSTSATNSNGTFTWGETGTTYTFADNSSCGLHCAESQSYNVVRWYTNAAASAWQIEPATVIAADLNAEKQAIQTASTSQLTTFFTSTACTALKSPYASYSDGDLTAAMSALPSTVQELALKIKNNTWTTYAGWNRGEKTYRVADYKPYSSSGRWTGIMGYGFSLGRLSNPTGIYAEAGEYLHVYVGDIPSGQSVQLEIAGYGQGSGTTYALSQGMNVVYTMNAGNCFVFYEVDNTTSGSTPYTPLASFAPVPVHIEGGTVQGYFDITKADPDTDEDWAYFKENLMTKDMFCLKSRNLVFNLSTDHLKTAVDGGGGSGSTGKVVEMMQYWDGIQDMEDELFNRASIADKGYCNNIHSVTTVGDYGAGLLYAHTYGIFFSPEQHNRLFNYELFRLGSDNLWASAHELGHHRQSPINMAGHTEVSNNLYSNVAVYQQGRYTSRTAGINAILEDFANGVSYPERIALANTSGYSGTYNQHLLMMNWQLYLFFHVNGNAPDFFPQLFNALRSDPMVKTAGTDRLTPASTDYLKYYVKCCEVSGYDLTDFFAAYGFFILPPVQPSSITDGGVTTNRYQTIGDYSTYNLYVTQEMIDEAKAAVSDMDLPKCNIIFIEDKVSAPLATYDGHSEGETKAVNDASLVTSFGACGDMGQYTDFDKNCSSYSYNVSSRGNVTVEGLGSVGLILYDSSGNVVGFYNTQTFSLPSGTFDEDGLLSGYVLKAAGGDGTTVAATYDSSIEVNEFPKTDVSYTICTPFRGGRFMLSNGSGNGMAGNNTATPTNAMKWQFVLRDGEKETFDIKNVSDNSYINPTATYNTQVSTTSARPSQGWKVKSAATKGMYIISTADGIQLNQTNNSATGGYAIYNWGSGSNTSDLGCQFLIAEAADLSASPLDEILNFYIVVSSTPAAEIETGKWYVMFDRGTNHGYLYEKTSSNSLYNTATPPTGGVITANNAKYLVRLSESGLDGKYYVQTGFGNYFYQIQNSTNVATTAYTSQPITIGKILDTDGHFYLQSYNNSVVLDANALTYGDATVVGWNATVPNYTDGNNDWAFYPVDFTWPFVLNVVGDASYTTLYLPYDMTLPENTTAYYITETSDGYARLTELTDGIPAYTASVLINSLAATYVILSMTDGLTSVVSKNDNLLKGTLTSMSLDLSDTSPSEPTKPILKCQKVVAAVSKASNCSSTTMLQASFLPSGRRKRGLQFSTFQASV